MCLYIIYTYIVRYGVASVCKLFKIISLICKRALQKRPYSAKETYDFKEPANRSHPRSEPIFLTYAYEYKSKATCIHHEKLCH